MAERIPASVGVEEAAKASGLWEMEDTPETDDQDDTPEPEQESGEEQGDENPSSERPELDDDSEESVEEPEIDFPDNWFGVNIKDFAEKYGVEAATEYFETLKAADRDANSKMRDMAERLKEAEVRRAEKAEQERYAEPEESEPTELTDEELLQNLGIDTSLLEYDELGKPVAALARLVTEQREQLENLVRTSQAEKQEEAFWGKFREQEATHGNLPSEYDKATIEEYALETGIFDPVALYRHIAFPTLVARANNPEPSTSDSRDKKKSLAGPRRRGAAPGSTKPSKPKTIKEAFEQAEAQLEISP